MVYYAVKKVVEIGKRAARGARQHRKICTLVTVDVKNKFKFNLTGIIEALWQKKNATGPNTFDSQLSQQSKPLLEQ